MNDADSLTSPARKYQSVGNSPEVAQTTESVQVLEKDDTFALDAMWAALERTTSPSVTNPVKPLAHPRISLYGSHYRTLIPNTESGEGVVSRGIVVQVLDYYPFGSERIDTGTDVSQRQFIGEMYDEESSMSYLNARYYQNTRGQFISQDPVFWEVGITSDGKGVLANPQAQNSYSYAGNNPIINKDPTGRIAPLLVALGYVYFAYNAADAAVDYYEYDLVTNKYPSQFTQTDRNNAKTELVMDSVSFVASFGLGPSADVALDSLSASLDILNLLKKGEVKDRMNQSLYQSTTGRDPATGKPVTNQSTFQNSQKPNSSQASLLKSLERTLKDLQKTLKSLSSSQNSSREKEKKNKKR